MRPTDFCHPIELRALAPRVFPARSRHFRGGEAPWSVRLHATLLRDRTFHDARRPLRRVDHAARRLRSLLPHGLENRTWAFSSHGADATEPLTPLSQPSSSPVGSPSRVHRGSRRLPRPPLSSSRESRCRVMIRDAFHRQGLFVGFGGRYSPGPATASPLLAMVRPLDDDLSSP